MLPTCFRKTASVWREKQIVYVAELVEQGVNKTRLCVHYLGSTDIERMGSLL